MAAKRKSDSDWVSWVVIAVLFMVGLSPIALVGLLLGSLAMTAVMCLCNLIFTPLFMGGTFRGSPPPLSPGGHSRRPEKSPNPRR